MTLYIANDHGGYRLKKQLLKRLKTETREVVDLGAADDRPSDYPLIAEMISNRLLADRGSLGLIICRSGQGACIAANKIKGIRAAQAWDRKSARRARNDDDANLLCLAGDFISPRKAESILKVFLKTEFQALARRRRRLNQIKDLEARC